MMSLRLFPSLTLLGAFFLTSIGVAQARLGETKEQCVARYGASSGTAKAAVEGSEKDALLFTKNGISIHIEFFDNKAWMIRYEKRDLNDAQTEFLLKANGDDAAWVGPVSHLGRKHWVTKSKLYHGMYRAIGNRRILEVMTDVCLKKRDSIRKAQQELVGKPEAEKLIKELSGDVGLDGF